MPRLFDQIVRQPIRWLWRGRIPLGKITLVEGDGAAGKSTLMTWLAAHTTRGDLDGDLDGAANAIIISAEDDPADTIRPRLESQGADLQRVVSVDDVVFPNSIERLRTQIRTYDAKLVIIDPVTSYLAPGYNMSDVSIRTALGGLKSVAAETGAAIVLLRHLNHNQKAPAYRRGLGGASLANLARTVWVVGRVGPTPVLAFVKGNLDGRIATSVPINMTEGTITIGEDLDLTADDVLAVSGLVRVNAVDWLRDHLGTTEHATTNVIRAAAEVGISQRTLERARSELGVQHRKLRGQTLIRLGGVNVLTGNRARRLA